MKPCWRNAWGPVALVAFILGPAWWANLDPNRYAGGRSRDDEARRQRNASAVATMLGELRTSISDIIMIKTDRYLHSGIGYAATAGGELMSTTATMEAMDSHQAGVGEGAHDHDHDHAQPSSESGGVQLNDAGAATLIPSPENDYRGVIGHLHRQVKPWQPPEQAHNHTDGTQMLPWFRVATLSDPRHVSSFALGGYWLSRHDASEASTFLEEGIEENPDSFQLHLVAAQVRFREAREAAEDSFNPAEKDLPVFLDARDRFVHAAELALAQRPHGKVDEDPNWLPYMEDDAWTALRMAVLTEKYYGDNHVAVERAKRYVGMAGLDPVLARIATEEMRGEER